MADPSPEQDHEEEGDDMDELALATAFEEHRPRLRAVAARMLGPGGEVDDAVQEAWLRLHRTDEDSIENLGAWLTTVVGRVCLDQLRSRTSRREDPIESRPDPVATDADPASRAEVSDLVGAALLVVLDALTPNERLSFVLHDMFGVPFDQVAQMLEVSPAAARQYASRGRRRVRGAEPPPARDERKQRVVSAFFAASKAGRFEELLELLAPGATLSGDRAAAAMGGPASIDGAEAVASFLSGRAKAARVVLLNGDPGAVWSLRGEVKAAFVLSVSAAGLVERIEVVADPERLAGLWVTGV